MRGLPALPQLAPGQRERRIPTPASQRRPRRHDVELTEVEVTKVKCTNITFTQGTLTEITFTKITFTKITFTQVDPTGRGLVQATIRDRVPSGRR